MVQRPRMIAAPAAQSAAAVPPTRILGIGQILPCMKLERLAGSQIRHQRVTRTALSQRYQLKRLHKGLRKRSPPVRWFHNQRTQKQQYVVRNGTHSPSE